VEVSRSLELLVAVVATRPLTVHVSLHNPATAAGPVLVPRPLTPLGAFVTLAVVDGRGSVVWESRRPKLGLKLHPDRRESYLELDPGYSHGVVVRSDGVTLPDGPCELRVSYSNGPYTGPSEAPIGELALAAVAPLDHG
jgi:hypothetical protein